MTDEIKGELLQATVEANTEAKRMVFKKDSQFAIHHEILDIFSLRDKLLALWSSQNNPKLGVPVDEVAWEEYIAMTDEIFRCFYSLDQTICNPQHPLYHPRGGIALAYTTGDGRLCKLEPSIAMKQGIYLQFWFLMTKDIKSKREPLDESE